MIIWVHVANTNRYSAALAHYFLKMVEVINESTTEIRGDLVPGISHV